MGYHATAAYADPLVTSETVRPEPQVSHPGSRFCRTVLVLWVACLTSTAEQTQAGGALTSEDVVQRGAAVLSDHLKGAGVEFNGLVVRDGQYYLDLQRTNLTDLSPVIGALFIRDDRSPPRWRCEVVATNSPGLALNICSTAVTNLSPLRGLPVALLWLASTRVADLSVLKGMPIVSLHIAQTEIADLSALEGMPLREIHLTPSMVKEGWDVLRHMPTLRRVNQVSRDEFFQRLDRGLWGPQSGSAVDGRTERGRSEGD